MGQMQNSEINGVRCVEFSGRLDAKAVDDYKADMQALADKKVVVDMTAVSFVDSSGLGLIVASFRRLQEDGGKLVLCGLNKQVQAVFELTRLHKIFEIYETRDQAINALT